MEAAKHTLRYIKLNPTQGILMSAKLDYRLTVYCDSDKASCPYTRLSISGFFLLHLETTLSYGILKAACK